MKTLFTLFSTLSLILLIGLFNHQENDSKVITEAVVFDGYEGEMYFFTNSNKQPMIIEDYSNALSKTYKLEFNNHIGENFKLSLKSDKKKTSVFSADAVVNLILQP